MTQQEIFKNMTKGEWKGNYTTHAQIQAADPNDKEWIRPVGIMGGNYHEEAEANMYGVCSAVNNTYGRGINPESVEKMKVYCELQEQWDAEGVFEYEGERYVDTGLNDHPALDLLTKLRKEALTAVKL